MYLSTINDTLEILSDSAATTTEPVYIISYNDHTATGMTLPQSSTQGVLTGATVVTALAAPSAATMRQIAYMTVYNSDTVTRVITVRKSVSANKYIVIKASLAPGATLQFSREAGWNIRSESVQESYLFKEYTSNGTWTKPGNLKSAFILCVGAGGGGGSGRRDAAGTVRYGGDGGGGGNTVTLFLSASSLSSSYAVTIGSGGSGGAGVTVNATDGNPGGAGGDTSFGSVVIAKGGAGGLGGQSVAHTSPGFTAGGDIRFSTPTYGPCSVTGGSGSVGQNYVTGATQAEDGFSGKQWTAGGSGGTGYNTSNQASTVANQGGGMSVNGVFNPTTSRVSTGTNGKSNWAKNLFFTTTLECVNGLGTGGAGGNTTTTLGSNGGDAGAGGGGGGASVNGTNSGAGGSGGKGLCVVMEIY